jgi:hypothetical protein
MNNKAICPSCQRQVTSDHQMEISGKHYAVFRCSYCRERLGNGNHAVSTQLTFAVNDDGRLLGLAELADLIAPPHKEDKFEGI